MGVKGAARRWGSCKTLAKGSQVRYAVLQRPAGRRLKVGVEPFVGILVTTYLHVIGIVVGNPFPRDGEWNAMCFFSCFGDLRG